MVYGTIAGWRDYATARGNSKPTDASDADALAALTRASDYIEFYYVRNFSPQLDPLPDDVVTATYIAASYELDSPGSLSNSFQTGTQKVLSKVDVIEWDVLSGSGDSKSESFGFGSTIIQEVEALLGRYINAGGLGVGVMVV